jgi:hypothetical protein
MKRMDKFVKFIMGKAPVSSKMVISIKENCSMDCSTEKGPLHGLMALSIKESLL